VPLVVPHFKMIIWSGKIPEEIGKESPEREPVHDAITLGTLVVSGT
jgi:hypothetical protein